MDGTDQDTDFGCAFFGQHEAKIFLSRTINCSNSTDGGSGQTVDFGLGAVGVNAQSCPLCAFSCLLQLMGKGQVAQQDVLDLPNNPMRHTLRIELTPELAQKVGRTISRAGLCVDHCHFGKLLVQTKAA